MTFFYTAAAETPEADALLKMFEGLRLSGILPAMILLAVGVLAIRVILKIVDRSMARSKLERAARSLIRSLLKVMLWLLLGLMVASRLGVDVTGVVALASVASLALSLSLQDALANVIGGFTLLSTHPFSSGDFVEIAGQSGTVEEIDMSYTKLATPDNKQVYIPNSAVVAAQIVNYSASETRRVEIVVSASYDAPTQKVIDALVKAGTVDKVLTDPAPVAVISSYGDSAITYSLRMWVKTDDYWDVYHRVNQSVKDIFDAQGIAMTYPHLNVHLQSN